VYTDVNIVMGAESADFFCDCWHLKVITDDGIETKNIVTINNDRLLQRTALPSTTAPIQSIKYATGRRILSSGTYRFIAL
jgi:hypothetical protein